MTTPESLSGTSQACFPWEVSRFFSGSVFGTGAFVEFLLGGRRRGSGMTVYYWRHAVSDGARSDTKGLRYDLALNEDEPVKRFDTR